MAKTKKKQEKSELEESLQLATGSLRLERMKHKDLQRACIIRGINFNDMCKLDTFGLQSWLIKNWLEPTKKELLNEFDAWRKKLLDEKHGQDQMPFVRLGFASDDTSKSKEGKAFKAHKEKKVKKPRKKDESTGLYSGTKKALTFECANEGLSLEKTVKKVKKTFPDAKDKSINIWYKRALKAGKKKK